MLGLEGIHGFLAQDDPLQAPHFHDLPVPDAGALLERGAIAMAGRPLVQYRIVLEDRGLHKQPRQPVADVFDQPPQPGKRLAQNRVERPARDVKDCHDDPQPPLHIEPEDQAYGSHLSAGDDVEAQHRQPGEQPTAPRVANLADPAEKPAFADELKNRHDQDDEAEQDGNRVGQGIQEAAPLALDPRGKRVPAPADPAEERLQDDGPEQGER